MAALISVTIVIGLVSGFAALAVYAERKIASFIQCRLGPMEVGPAREVKIFGRTILPAGWYGLGVILADGLKLLSKEDIIPAQADRALFRLAPYLIFAATLASFAAVPIGFFLPSDIDAGILFILAASSVGVFGIVMGGYASNNKWSLFGAMRAVAQIVSYEIPLGIALLSVVLTVGSLRLDEIALAQAGGFWNWHLFKNVFLFSAFFIYVIAALAETNRAPFDIPEAESELVAGYHTEYSGMRFAIFFLAEYANVFLVSLVGAIFFLGGPNTGLGFDHIVLGPIVVLGKAALLVFVIIWLRWTLPRFRVDRLMILCWKGLIPVSLIAFLGAGVAVFQTGMEYQILWRALIVAAVVYFIAAVRVKA